MVINVKVIEVKVTATEREKPIIQKGSITGEDEEVNKGLMVIIGERFWFLGQESGTMKITRIEPSEEVFPKKLEPFRPVYLLSEQDLHIYFRPIK